MTMVSEVPAARPGRLVTPEAVPLDVELAGIPTRALAAVLDLLVVGGGFGVVAAIVSSTLAGTAGIVVLIVTGFLGLFGYPAVAEVLLRGRTVGKLALGLRVVTVEGTPVRFRHTAIRAGLRIVDVLLPPIAFVGVAVMLCSPRRQRAGDVVAGTVVVRERTGAMGGGAMLFPPLPGWERYVAALDTSALTAPQYELVRSYLTRVQTLRPAARTALALELGSGIARAIGHTPPPGMHPEPFLAAVASAHQRRHGAPWATTGPAPSQQPPPARPPPPAAWGPPTGRGPADRFP
jgi:uncharacterized RDD family membrane protein YckC